MKTDAPPMQDYHSIGPGEPVDDRRNQPHDETPSGQVCKRKHDDKDGRQPYDWETRYPKQAWVQIIIEAAYTILLGLVTLLLLFLNWTGTLASLSPIPVPSTEVFSNLVCYMLAAQLGGVAFGAKYLYRVVGRGEWHQDRAIWRVMSPFVALLLGLAVAPLMYASFINNHLGPSAGIAKFILGFIVGFFADQAAGKLNDVAKVLFGDNGT